MRNGSTQVACAVAWLCLAVAIPAIAGGADARLTTFMEESSARIDADDMGLEGQLYRWAKAGDDLPALRTKAAEHFRLPPSLADRLVDLVLERGSLGYRDDKAATDLVPKFLALVLEHPDNVVVAAEAAHAIDEAKDGPCNVDDYRVLLENKSDASADAARVAIYDAVYCLPLLTERTALRHGDATSYVDLAKQHREIDSDWLRLAILRLADDKAAHDAHIDEKTRAEMHKLRVLLEIELDHFKEAVALLPASVDAWPAFAQAMDPLDRRSIAATWLLQGNEAQARAWFATADQPERVPATEQSYERNKRESRDYTIAMLQRAFDAPAREDFAFLTRWFRVDDLPHYGVWYALFDRLAVAQGYPALASDAYERNVAEEKRDALDACGRCAPELIATIEDIAKHYVVPTSPKDDASPPLPAPVRARMDAVLAMPRPAWREHSLPTAMRTNRETPEPVEEDSDDALAALFSPGMASGPEAPSWAKHLPEGTLVRHATDGKRVVAITASQSLDPTGEISEGGYWVSVSDDGGATFAPPLYTGMRMYAPYVVLSESKLPMLDGDRLRLEVAVRQLDDEHVMLPPVVLPFLEHRDDVYVEITLAELARDADNDGLTDLAEWAMLLAPDAADTDDDGIVDGMDALPHVAATTRNAAAPVMVEALHSMMGDTFNAIVTTSATDAIPGRTHPLGTAPVAYGAERTMFLRAPPAYFAGLSVGQRIIVLDDAQLDRLSQARGTSFATGIRTFALSHDGNMALVVWSSGRPDGRAARCCSRATARAGRSSDFRSG